VLEDEESGVAIEEVKGLIKGLRYKLIQKTQGNHDEYILRKLFNDFDLNKSGNITIDELAIMLFKLDFPIQKKFL